MLQIVVLDNYAFVVLLLDLHDPHICPMLITSLLLLHVSTASKFWGLGHFSVMCPIEIEIVSLFTPDLRVLILIRWQAGCRHNMDFLRLLSIHSYRVLLRRRIDQGMLLSNRAETL